MQVWRYVCCELWHWLKAVGPTLGQRGAYPWAKRALPLGKEGPTLGQRGAYPWAKRALPLGKEGKEGKEGKAITIYPAMLH